MNKFKIKVNQIGQGTIELNGTQLEGVTGFKITASINKLTRIKVEYLAEIEIVGEGEVND